MKTTIFAAAVLAAATTAQAQDEKHFDGGFVGIEGGYLDGDFLDGEYYGGYAGFRKQLDNGVVFGIEGSLGKTSVDPYFDESDSEDFFKSQWSTLGTIGYATGRNLFSLGAGYARVNSSYTYSGVENDASTDGFAGMVSYERALGDLLSLRAHVTTYEFETYIGTIGLGLRF